MKTIRVFVSSPGDVQAERTIADRLIRTIAEELTIPVSVQYSNLLRDGEAVESFNGSAQADSGELMLCPYFWEYQRFSPEMGYQDQIPNTAQFDLVISILWSRLGTKLHPRFQMPDGSEPRSGTEFEIAWAKAQHAKTPGIPALHVYRNRSQPNPPLDPPAVREEFFRQWDSLKGFFESWEKDSQGQFVGAFNNYNNLEEFERLFREHFRDFLATQISSEHSRQWLAKRSQARRWKENPFRGLQTFDFEHAPIFAGRTLAIDGVLAALSQQAEAGRPFVLVLGASGSGKSSLVRAGVLPLLVEPGVIEGIGLWRRSVMRPGAGGSQSDMFDALAAGLLAQEGLPELADLESSEPVKDLADELRANPQGVADRVKDKLNQVASEYRLRQEQRLRELESGFRDQKREADAENARLQREKLEPPRARLALVVDQLEQLFTSGFSEELQLKFINALSVLARSGRVFLLVTLRNDFYDRYQQFTDLVELAKPSGKYDLQPPTPQELGRMIRLPAQAAGLDFERDEALGQTLDEALRDSAAADPQALPLLEHVLTRLYELQEKRGDRILSWSDYRILGEMNGALANHAEEVFSALGPTEQGAFPLVMRYLVTLGHGEEEVPNRRTAPYKDFLALGAADHDPRAGAKGCVDRLIEKRLLVADTDPHGEITVSVAHEALLREWVRVKSWLAENREFLRMRDRLHSSLRLWLSRGKQKDDLLGPGLPVAEGERLVNEFATSLSREEIDYIKASTAERKRREQARARQFQVAAGVLFVLLCAASIGAYFGFTGRVEAEKQKQDAVTAQRNLEAKNRELGSMLEEASWASFNQAERQFHLGQWNEGIALLARAEKFDPKNQIASERFFQQLILDRWKVTTPLATFQHEGDVTSAVFSSDGARILTASADRTARLWDGGSGKLLATFQHEGPVSSAVFSPDGARILTASWDKTARLWDGGSGKLLATFQHESGVNSAVFSPDGARILTVSADNTARLWDGGSGKLLATFQNEDGANSAVFSPDGARILKASWDKTARLWDGGSGKLLATFQHEGGVTSAVFSPDGALILTASGDYTARLWDGGSGKLLATFQHESDVRSAVFSPDGARILTASWDKTARLWDGGSGKLLATFQHEGEVRSAVFSPGGTRILTVSADRTARLWDGGAGKLLATFQHEGEVRSAVFSSDGARILTASADRTARLWDGGSGKLLATFQHKGEVRSAVFSPDGARILTASADSAARLWDGGSGKLLATFQHEGEVTSAVFSPDGARILTASADRTARLWDGGSGKLLATFQHEGDVTSAVFSPDGARFLTASADRTARLWDGGSGKLLATFQHESEVTSAAQEKSWLTHIFGATFQHESEVSSAVFSPDGARILTVSRDKTARLWDATIARSLARLMVESQALRQVGLLSELASGLEISEDGSLTAIPSGRRFELITQVRDSAKDDELMSRFIRWFCSPIEERTIFPDSKMNNATWLDNQIVSIPSVPKSLV